MLVHCAGALPGCLGSLFQADCLPDALSPWQLADNCWAACAAPESVGPNRPAPAAAVACPRRRRSAAAVLKVLIDCDGLMAINQVTSPARRACVRPAQDERRRGGAKRPTTPERRCPARRGSTRARGVGPHTAAARIAAPDRVPGGRQGMAGPPGRGRAGPHAGGCSSDLPGLVYLLVALPSITLPPTASPGHCPPPGAPRKRAPPPLHTQLVAAMSTRADAKGPAARRPVKKGAPGVQLPAGGGLPGRCGRLSGAAPLGVCAWRPPGAFP